MRQQYVLVLLVLAMFVSSCGGGSSGSGGTDQAPPSTLWLEDVDLVQSPSFNVREEDKNIVAASNIKEVSVVRRFRMDAPNQAGKVTVTVLETNFRCRKSELPIVKIAVFPTRDVAVDQESLWVSPTVEGIAFAASESPHLAVRLKDSSDCSMATVKFTALVTREARPVTSRGPEASPSPTATSAPAPSRAPGPQGVT